MKKIISIIAMALAVMTASAKELSGYQLTQAESELGKLTFKVEGSAVTRAEAGATVTIVATPNDGYAATAMAVRAAGQWEGAKARGITVTGNVTVTRVALNEYTFVMPAADVQVTAQFDLSAPVPAEENKAGGKDVDGASVVLQPDKNAQPTTEGDVTYMPVTVSSIDMVKAAEGATQEITVTIPAMMASATGKIQFVVTGIALDALKTPEGSNTKVTKVILPETEQPLEVAEGALSPNGTPVAVEAPLALLDDYALMTALQENFEAQKVSATVKAPNKYWSFSSGVDCVLPEGVTAYIAVWDAKYLTIRIVPLTEEQMKLADGRRGIKANNGVLIAGEPDKVYEIVASPGNQQSGAKPATTDVQSYPHNCLVPTIEATNYESGDYLVLKDNQFHNIKSSATKVKACKAVFSVKKAGATKPLEVRV